MDSFARLEQLAGNLWWSWHPRATRMFEDLGGDAWARLGHNPVALLREMGKAGMEARVEALDLEEEVESLCRIFDEAMTTTRTLAHERAGPLLARPVAYFSAEFGVHESLPIYSGGLGVLAGDHLKAASDLGLPLVAIGLLYAEGYFRQRIDESGLQVESYPRTDRRTLAANRMTDADGTPVRIEIPLGESTVHAEIWQVRVGRTQLLLLDADIEPNAPAQREITARLYGGGKELRLHQEILLGIGGIRALAALGIEPAVLHLNEGHCALATLEATRAAMEREGLSFEDAHQDIGRMSVFTTHTPVAAGHDRFDPELVLSLLDWLREGLGLEKRDFLGMGRVDVGDVTEPFCMTVLALRTCDRANGVSALHGHVSRKMWKEMWRRRSLSDVPIGHVTNGVHAPTWISPALGALLDTHLPAAWREGLHLGGTWEQVASLEPGALWDLRCAQRRALLEFVFERTGRRLDPERLTLGFARRFATYKRAGLLFSDLDRARRLLTDRARPIQILFAGKAHPDDAPGKDLVRQIWELSQDPVFGEHVVFLEDYDLDVGRVVTQGVDGWVNNPRRPLEACGTSGQKVAMNGGLNISILDGWWAEAWDGTNGFAIGGTRVHQDADTQDRYDAEALYQVLEREVAPTFYERNPQGIPITWAEMMKRSLLTCGWRFSARRMVVDYLDHAYLPAATATQIAVDGR